MTNPSDTSIDLPALLRGAGAWTLDPKASGVEFHVKHFWGVMTVHGHFESVTGNGRVDPDGTASGQIVIAADSVDTKNKKRDEHLRSIDFFDAESHPSITVRAAGLTPSGGRELLGPFTLATAGHEQVVDAVVHVVSATAEDVMLRAEATVDRTAFGMTWSPLRMTAPEARVVVTARFARN